MSKTSKIGKLLSVLLATLFLVFASNPVLKAQDFQDENAVKSKLIWKLAEYFKWNHEDIMSKFVMAVFEDESKLTPYFISLSKNTRINNKPVELKRIKSLNDLASVNLLYIDPDRSKNAPRYYESVKGKNILLITDQCETAEESMINLIITKDSKLSFEINKKNLERENFTVPNDLLVLGGSQLEIKAVFDETQKNLQSIQTKLKEQEEELESQKRIISTQQYQMDNQRQTITRQNEEINIRRNTYNQLKISIDSTAKVLDSVTYKIDAEKKNILMRDSLIKKQESRINEQAAILVKQMSEIETGRKRIESQNEDLKKQGSKINEQRYIIALSAVFFFLLTMLLIIILRINRVNKKINLQMFEKNRQIELQKQVLEDQKRQLEISNSELESFSYSISHDLRAPLRVIDGYSNIMLNDMNGLDQEAKDFLTKIISSSKKMAILIDDLLKLGKITRQTLVKENFDLSIHIEGIVDELKSYYPDRTIQIKLAKGIKADGDPRLLSIALHNIIDNAFKFTSNTENALIEIGTENREGKTVYFVKDNGAGFDMSNSKRLFQAFQRLPESSEFPGTGIGLTIVQRIINRHGGTIWLDSKPELGTNVFFTLS